MAVFFMGENAIPISLKIIINGVLIFLIAQLGYNGSARNKLVLSLLFLTVWALFELLTLYIFMLMSLDLSVLIRVAELISKLLTLLLILALKKFFSMHSIYDLPMKYNLMLMLLPVISLFLIYNIFVLTIHNNNAEVLLFSMMALAVVLGVNVMVFFLYASMSKEFEKQRRNAVLVQQLDRYDQHIKEKESQIQESRKNRHDLKHHFFMMQSLIDAKKIPELEQYIEKLNEHVVPKRNEFSNTENFVIDALVNHKLQLAKEHGAEVYADIQVPMSLPFENADLGVLIGNIVDNAWEATQKYAEENYIKLFIRYSDQTLYITCLNSYDGTMNKDQQGRIRTGKKDRGRHGYGLMSIQSIAQKYNGTMTIEEDEKEFKIKVFLMESVEKKSYK